MISVLEVVVVSSTCLFVASEENAMSLFGNSSSYFLGVFTSEAHLNAGVSDDWANLEWFTTQALMVALAHLGLSGMPERLA